jgi:hypothetical protein
LEKSINSATHLSKAAAAWLTHLQHAIGILEANEFSDLDFTDCPPMFGGWDDDATRSAVRGDTNYTCAEASVNNNWVAWTPTHAYINGVHIKTQKFVKITHCRLLY